MKLGRDLLRQFGTLFSPDSLIRRHRWLVARKYDSSDRRGKRGPAPTKANMIRKLVLQMALSCGHPIAGLAQVRLLYVAEL
jgi:putative transposase